MKSCILYFLPSFRSYGAKKIQQYNFCDFRYISVPIDQIDCKSCIFLEVVFFLHRKNGGYIVRGRGRGGIHKSVRCCD